MQANPVGPTGVRAYHVDPTTHVSTMDEQSASVFLSNHGWPTGLQRALFRNIALIPMRYFICDDSGSMVTGDGHRLVGEGARKASVPASRWAELGDFVRFHAGLSEAAKAPSQFRMLNGAPPINVGTGMDGGSNLGVLTALLDNSPGGGTPLCAHIRAVVQEIRGMLLAPKYAICLKSSASFLQLWSPRCERISRR
jgi:hypothetical protein